MKRNVKFFFTDPNSLMVQPALCAHTVITWNGGPALVMGFEGKQKMTLLGKSRCYSIIRPVFRKT